MIHNGEMSTEENVPAKSKNPEDYDVFDKQALAKYTTDTGKILPIKYTGLTPMQQRKVSKLIKKARHLQLLH
jgi:small subunit ribosomal protein S18